MKTIQELQGYVIDENGNVFDERTKKEIKSYLAHGYLVYMLKVNGKLKSVSKHKLCYKYHNEDYQLFNGYSYVIDHIDTNKLNNHISNLRLVSLRENCSKERTVKSGLPTGVSYHKKLNKYRVDICIENQYYHLGTYNTVEDAENSYKTALYNWETNNTKPFKKELSSEIKGISYNKREKKWIFQTTLNGGFHGYFKTEQEAINKKNEFFGT